MLIREKVLNLNNKKLDKYRAGMKGNKGAVRRMRTSL